jgi:predicted DNA-binding transcriptional regulator AlpA
MTRIELDWKGGKVSDVLYVADVAEKLGMTESAVRMAVARDKGRGERKRALPKPFKIGAKLAWRRVDLDVWLARKAGDA